MLVGIYSTLKKNYFVTLNIIVKKIIKKYMKIKR